jgi:hypothetical protein
VQRNWLCAVLRGYLSCAQNWLYAVLRGYLNCALNLVVCCAKRIFKLCAELGCVLCREDI